MGREIRRVPEDWEHPVYTDDLVTESQRGRIGKPIAMYDEDIETATRKWVDGAALWIQGKHPDQQFAAENGTDYPDWYERTFYAYSTHESRSPDPESYRRPFVSEPTHYQVYETVSEGTPVSPVFATTDEMIDWLTSVPMGGVNEVPLSRKAAAKFVEYEYAPSFIVDARGLRTGVEALEDA